MPILPHSLEPDPEALAHSGRLRAHINACLHEAGGWLDFARFMTLALYAPGLGYYSAGAVKLGAHGDFVTAPELTPLFAQTLAGPVAGSLANLPSSSRTLMELGAGTGRLAHDLLLALQAQDRLPDRYWILEVSPDLRARQQATLAALPAALGGCVAWRETWPDQWGGVLLANEVLDALPVHRVGWRGDRWVEIGVALEGSDWVWEERSLAEPRLLARLPDARTWPVPYDTEIGLAATDLVATLARSLQAGSAYFIDYGFPAREYFHPQRQGGTLMCHIRHHAHPDPLAYPGLQDITAHVDFTAVARSATSHGLAVKTYDTLAGWLIGAGITDRLGRIPVSDGSRYFPAVAAVQKLLSPAEMGELFKVLVLEAGAGPFPLPPALAG